MRPGPTVSIILPVYNAGPDLDECLDRLDHTYSGSEEILLVDDGSTDDTRDRLARYAANKAYVRLINIGSNGGVARARNAALDCARGEYVWFVDWDDEWNPLIVREMVALAEDAGADVVVSAATWRLPSGLDYGRCEALSGKRVIDGWAAFEMVLKGELKGYLWSKLLRRELLPPRMFPPMSSQSDFCGLIPVIAAAKRVLIDPTVRYHHVVRVNSITNSRNPRIGNLDICRDVVQATACAMPRLTKVRTLLLHYDYAFWHLSRINTALRLSSPVDADKVVRDTVSAMRMAEVVSVARVSPVVAAKATLVKLTGRNYGRVRAGAVALQSTARALRRGVQVAFGRVKSVEERLDER